LRAPSSLLLKECFQDPIKPNKMTHTIQSWAKEEGTQQRQKLLALKVLSMPEKVAQHLKDIPQMKPWKNSAVN
jgi:hypothetical protein